MTDTDPDLPTPIAQHVWQTRYRPGDEETSVADTWRRVARSLAAVEPADQALWERRFLDILRDFRFLPGGRILAGAGTARDVTLCNCFVMGTIEDSVPGIFRALQEGAVTMQWGGGVGYDFSTLRPRGAQAQATGMIASGPVSFMDVWDAMCATIQSTGARRGAMMAALRCDHPDILEFIDAKRRPGRLRHFNLSVLVTDALMQAVAQNADWPLVFPAACAGEGETVPRPWPGSAGPSPCRVLCRVPARVLWDRLLRASYDTGEPGVLFIDRINRLNTLWYAERIAATNPCGEVPLPPYGACNLGSINLPRLVLDPFTPRARLDADRLEAVVAVGVRLLDNVIELSRFPLPAQQDVVRQSRRLGLGITGLADALVMLGLRYGSDASLAWAEAVMRRICLAAYRQSAALAQAKGAFPALDRQRYLQGPFVAALPPALRDAIARHGIRNSHLLAIAPTGTISLLAGNVSSGIEPVFAADGSRAVLDRTGQPRPFAVTDYAVALWRARAGSCDGVPDALITALALPAEAHVAMQAVLQPWVDNAISKTINVPAATSFAAFAPLYRLAYDRGLKGCTTFRPNTPTGSVLTAPARARDGCCVADGCE